MSQSNSKRKRECKPFPITSSGVRNIIPPAMIIDCHSSYLPRWSEKGSRGLLWEGWRIFIHLQKFKGKDGGCRRFDCLDGRIRNRIVLSFVGFLGANLISVPFITSIWWNPHPGIQTRINWFLWSSFFQIQIGQGKNWIGPSREEQREGSGEIAFLPWWNDLSGYSFYEADPHRNGKQGILFSSIPMKRSAIPTREKGKTPRRPLCYELIPPHSQTFHHFRHWEEAFLSMNWCQKWQRAWLHVYTIQRRLAFSLFEEDLRDGQWRSWGQRRSFLEQTFFWFHSKIFKEWKESGLSRRLEKDPRPHFQTVSIRQEASDEAWPFWITTAKPRVLFIIWMPGQRSSASSLLFWSESSSPPTSFLLSAFLAVNSDRHRSFARLPLGHLPNYVRSLLFLLSWLFPSLSLKKDAVGGG